MSTGMQSRRKKFTTKMPHKYHIHTFITQRTNPKAGFHVFDWTCLHAAPIHFLATPAPHSRPFPSQRILAPFLSLQATARLPHPPSTSTAETHLTTYSPPFPCACPSPQSHPFPFSPPSQRFPSHLPSLHPCSPPPWSSW
jgi:hypothetical protein